MILHISITVYDYILQQWSAVVVLISRRLPCYYFEKYDIIFMYANRVIKFYANVIVLNDSNDYRGGIIFIVRVHVICTHI